MVRKAGQYIEKHNMLSNGDRIVIGVSGGADSVSLLLMLLEWRRIYSLELFVVHVNHGIRGISAKRDEDFVRDLCEKKQVHFECVYADVPRLAAESGCSEEEEGRKLRYASFVEACERHGCNKIAVAHNREDNAETVLFNLFRGSGLAGIRGIAPVRQEKGIEIIRPVLCLSRSEIEEYLEEQAQTYCTDETNSMTDYSRNRLRNEVIPYIQREINSGAVRHINELAEQAGELESCINDITMQSMAGLEERNELVYEEAAGSLLQIKADCARLSELNPVLVKSIIRSLLGRFAGSLKDIENKHILATASLLDKPVGKSIDLPYGMKVDRGYRQLIFKKQVTQCMKKEKCNRASGSVEGNITEDGIGCTAPGDYYIEYFEGVLHLELREYKKCDIIPKKRYTKWFDYDKIRNNLVIRSRRAGDYLGIRKADNEIGRKTLKNYFIDAKLDRAERDRIPLLADGDSIVWIIGDRGSDEYLVTEGTGTVLVAELQMNN